MKVHTSNYVVQGFTKNVSVAEVAQVARSFGLPSVCDMGSGVLLNPEKCGEREHTVAEIVAAGADLVTFSGDKLLGGPQTGFIAGRRDLIAEINRNPMKRALRLDKIRMAALEATLRLYRNPDQVTKRLPTYRLIQRSVDEIREVSRQLVSLVRDTLGREFEVEAVDCEGEVGSGAFPLEKLSSAGIAIRSRVEHAGRALIDLSAALRALPIPVIGRIDRGALILDMRCLEDIASFSQNVTHLPQNTRSSEGNQSADRTDTKPSSRTSS
jgi:L-seryl-tRNA(Ser) seleniumtransferase